MDLRIAEHREKPSLLGMNATLGDLNIMGVEKPMNATIGLYVRYIDLDELRFDSRSNMSAAYSIRNRD